MVLGCGGASFIPDGRDEVFWGKGLQQRSPLPAGHLSEEKIELWSFFSGSFFCLFSSMIRNVEN